MNINVNIDRIVLDGDDFASFHPQDLRAAITAQLITQFSNQSFNLNDGFNAHRITSAEISQQSMTSPDSLATSVANSISSAIGT